jgi:hypothetical protein
MGAAPLWRSRPVRAWAFEVSAGLLLIAVVRPALLSGANRLWMRLGQLLHRVMHPLASGLLFFAIVTPLGLLLRALGKDPLRLKPCHRSSYWVLRDPPGPAPKTMTNQF